MAKKHGLGKGLNALIPENVVQNDKNEIQNENFLNNVKKIPINLIKPNKEQPRKEFDVEKIIKLAESIKQYGIIQPIVLKKIDETYIIVAGERRWRAAKHIGLKEIPSVVIDADEEKTLEISLIENLQREDLNPIEEAITYKKLINDFNITQEKLSKIIGKSRVAISNCMRLLNLDKRVQQMLIEKLITEGHGRALLAIKDKDEQYLLSKKIVDKNLSVRDVEKYIRNLEQQKHKTKPNMQNEDPYINEIKEKLENFFNTKVFIKNKKKKGKIEIEYYSYEDLERIIDLIKLQK